MNSKNNSKKKSEVTLGIAVENSASHREVLNNLENKLKKNNEKVKAFKSKVDGLKKFNNKLSDGYQLSLQMVVDVSDLLHRYVKIFETLEIMMKDIESTFEFNEEDFQYIRNLTEKSIIDLQSKMHKQIDSMVVIFEKQGMKKESIEIKRFKELSFEITNNASKITKVNISKERSVNVKNAKSNNSKGKNVKAQNSKEKNVKSKKTLGQKWKEIMYK